MHGTGALAEAAGARVVVNGGPPPGWLGKPAACRVGVDVTDAPVLVFVDADVSPPGDLVERLAAIVDAHPGALVSVQPWHLPGSAAEQLSLPFNVIALMGSGACLPRPGRAPLAFGPVLACRRERYETVGGHGHPSVRVAVAEDIALGRRFGETVVFSGPSDVTFRMFPGGIRGVLDGWTKHVAVGATAAAPLPAVLAVAWVWSQLAAWVLGPMCGALAVAQLWVLARRAGRFAWWAIALGPVLFLVFSAVVVRSFLRRIGGATGSVEGPFGRDALRLRASGRRPARGSTAARRRSHGCRRGRDGCRPCAGGR